MIPRASIGVMERVMLASESKESFWKREGVGLSSREKGDTKMDMSPGPPAQNRKSREQFGHCPQSCPGVLVMPLKLILRSWRTDISPFLVSEHWVQVTQV